MRIKRVRVMQSCLYFLAVSDNMNSEVFGHILVKGVGVESHMDEEEGSEYKHTWLRRGAGILYVGPFKKIKQSCCIAKNQIARFSCFLYFEHAPFGVRAESAPVVCGPFVKTTVDVSCSVPVRNHFVESLLAFKRPHLQRVQLERH